MSDASRPALTSAEARLERWRQQAGLVAGPLLFLILWWLPFPTLSEPAHRTLCVMGLVGTLWLTEALPLAATALLGPALCVILGVAPARDALRPFSDPVIFLFLGGFLLAEAMVKHGLNRRIAFAVLSLKPIARSHLGLLTGFGLLTAAISAWVSNTATAAMMLPIAISILTEISRGTPAEGDWRQAPGARELVLVTAFAASLGGLATPIGTPPNIIGVGLIDRILGKRLNFLEWMQVAVPAAVCLTGLIVWRLHRVARGRAEWSPSRQWIRSETSRLGPWSRPQIHVAVLFSLAVFFWILPGILSLIMGRDAPAVTWLHDHLPEGVIALMAAIVLFALPAGRTNRERTLTWADATRIDWGTILLFGGGMALGQMMFDTGLARWIGESLAFALPSRSVFWLALLFAALGTLVSETTSNTASATMMIPLAIAVAQAAEVDPMKPALAACLGSSLGFMLPVSTPPNALAYGTGAVPLMAMVRHGLWLDVAGCILVVASVMALAP